MSMDLGAPRTMDMQVKQQEQDKKANVSGRYKLFFLKENEPHLNFVPANLIIYSDLRPVFKIRTGETSFFEQRTPAD